jgi:chemotaxis protein MotB
MSKKNPRPKPPPKPGCPAWMMTFGDAMSLLVTFFVMLIAFSTLEEAKLATLIGILRGAFGAVDLELALGVVERQAITDVDRASEAELEHSVRGEEESLRFLTQDEMADMLPEFIDKIRRHDADSVSDRLLIQMLDGGLTILLQTSNLFEDGSVTLRENYDALWQSIHWLLQGRDNEIRITAFTSSTAPVQRDVAATGWGLGIARANIIAHTMQDFMNAPVERYSIGVQLYDEIDHDPREDHLEIMIQEKGFVLDIDPDAEWPAGVWR